MKVIEVNYTPGENAISSLTRIDFSDTFATTNHTNSITEITQLIFGRSPKWIRALFAVRNFMVRFIGLKNDKPADYNVGFEVGHYIGFFRIFSITENEMLLGADDTHLNFRAVITSSQTPLYNIKVTTLVSYNNRKGRMYMQFIKPFHRMVVKNMVQQAYKNPDSEAKPKRKKSLNLAK
ncbi:DUF2867 domain-containing protein [Flavobacterium sp. CAU 1735]|uniref:DUF2867 domain-containing protein n=1 Tax=Flavobacterium sp. CAU 1735 TaxID=3140361 RepID=UPI0032616C8F